MITFLSFLFFAGLVSYMLARRRRRARQLAGLVATKPTFTVEPPRRRMSTMKGDRL